MCPNMRRRMFVGWEVRDRCGLGSGESPGRGWLCCEIAADVLCGQLVDGPSLGRRYPTTTSPQRTWKTLRVCHERLGKPLGAVSLGLG